MSPSSNDAAISTNLAISVQAEDGGILAEDKQEEQNDWQYNEGGVNKIISCCCLLYDTCELLETICSKM